MLALMARAIRRLASAALLPAAFVAGCGGGGPSPREGAAVFASSCTGCHTLAARPRVNPVGGSLRGYHLTVAQAEAAVRVMPVRTKLTARQLEAVSRYIVSLDR
jgi:mono/diheme cytochrome c family protein